MAREKEPPGGDPTDGYAEFITGDAGPHDVDMPGSAIVENKFTKDLKVIYDKATAFVDAIKGRGAGMRKKAKADEDDIVAGEYNRAIRVLKGKNMAEITKAVEITAVVAGTAAALATSVIIYRHLKHPEAEGKSAKPAKPPQARKTK